MRQTFFFHGFFILFFFLFIPDNRNQSFTDADPLFRIQKKKLQALKCYPDLTQDNLLPEDAMSMIPLPDWGKHQWKISTKSDSAQFYFNQGVTMYYSFHIIEALASFKKARTIDSTSAMCWWGEALSYGPNINDVEYAAAPDALFAAQKASVLSTAASAREKGLINAMMVRYTNDTSVSRADLNNRYLNSMKSLYKQFPNDAEVGTLYADAIMLVHPWDLYDDQSLPKPWTPELTGVLEKMIKLNPNHPGANHYYIHAVEASLNPEKANHSATVLPRITPKVSHTVHMPSHIYIRTGDFEKGMQVNIAANKSYSEYLGLMPEVVNNAFLYQLHNVHMQANCAMMFGDAQLSAETAAGCRSDIPVEYLSWDAPFGEYIQYMYMTPAFDLIRYGKWNDILQMAEIPDSLAYAKIIFHFSRGTAFARQQQTLSAKQELTKMQQILENTPKLKIKMGAFNSAYDAGKVAENMLSGFIAESENQYMKAAELLTMAVDSETKLVYNEPRDWILPARAYLGNVLLKDKKFADAERVFRKDLVIHPGNGWSTIGLSKALEGQGKSAAAKTVLTKAKLDVQNKNFNPAGPVF
ncbi:hypothetical protein [Pollutibacter soli]|uniref:tetratricopeptide repeat protein n=1 Tax=Pollutibacter soli TaxID=3034157 RepID=UPI003013ABC3